MKPTRRNFLLIVASKKRVVIFASCLSILMTVGVFVAPMLRADTTSTDAVLQRDGKLLARYRFGDVPFKPYIDELRTPSGKNILRDAPADHLHHHALMYAIRVNKYNFWEESGPLVGKQVTVRLQHSDHFIESEIDWNTSEPKTLLKENRKISVERGDGVTLLDWQCTIKAVDDVTLGVEGAGHYNGIGMRFVQEMDNGGRFFNDTGKKDGENVRGSERLTPCRWMAYTAKLDGQSVTVALFDHPSNPISMEAFTMGDTGGPFAYLSATMNLHRKPVELKAGQTFVIKYCIAVWNGEVSPEVVEAQYREFVR
jgi:hypothetical protein